MNSHVARWSAYVSSSHGTLFGLGVVLVLVGMLLRVKLSHHWMNAEERTKDGWLNEEQARRRIALMRYAGPLMIVLGMCVFALLFWN